MNARKLMVVAALVVGAMSAVAQVSLDSCRHMALRGLILFCLNSWVMSAISDSTLFFSFCGPGLGPWTIY